MFAPNVDLLCMEPKSFGFHKTEGANNHIKQSDTFFFARNPIGVTYNQLPAMLTNTVHKFQWGGKEYAISNWFINVQGENKIDSRT